MSFVCLNALWRPIVIFGFGFIKTKLLFFFKVNPEREREGDREREQQSYDVLTENIKTTSQQLSPAQYSLVWKQYYCAVVVWFTSRIVQFFFFIFAKSDLAGLTAFSTFSIFWRGNCPAENKLKMNDFTFKSPISQLVQFFFVFF